MWRHRSANTLGTQPNYRDMEFLNELLLVIRVSRTSLSSHDYTTGKLTSLFYTYTTGKLQNAHTPYVFINTIYSPTTDKHFTKSRNWTMTTESRRPYVSFLGHVFAPKLLESEIPSRWPWARGLRLLSRFFNVLRVTYGPRC